jgi:type I restriction enzyme S subunit
MSDELPKGWVWAKMLDILDYEGGSQPPKKDFVYEPREGYVRLMQIRDFGDKPFPTYVPDSKRLKKATRDDLLLARYGGSSGSDSLGRICTGLDGAYNVALAKLIFRRDELEKKYVRYLFLGPWFREKVSQNSRSCQTGFNREDVEDIEFPIAPLAEQRRIVAKLEKLLGRVDACQQRLAKIPALIKRFRQSVLAAACSGRLTADWREAHSTSAPSALLREENGSRRDAEDAEELPKLPESWCWTQFGDLISEGPQNGLYKPAEFYGDGTLIVRIDAFYDGTIAAWSELKRVRLTDKECSQFALQNGDILVNRVNSPKFLGKSALVRKLKESCVYESNMMRLRLDTSRALPDYAILYLQSIPGLVELRKNAKHAVNQSSINQEDVKAALFSLPPLPEQQEIVRRVEVMFALADQIEVRFQKAQAQVDKLTPSLLAKAFRGQLVPQDPCDEPAEKLLERIKAKGKSHVTR